MADRLPHFRFHPDPIETRSIQASGNTCRCCGERRGWIYTGPVFAVEELVEELCPWCIANGSAAETFDAEFTDVGWGVPEGVPPEVLLEIAKRTPGFCGWQQEHWLYHCDDGAEFLGRVGYEELLQSRDALEMVLHENDQYGWTSEQSQAYAETLSANGEATAYLFRCLHCARALAYSDMS